MVLAFAEPGLEVRVMDRVPAKSHAVLGDDSVPEVCPRRITL